MGGTYLNPLLPVEYAVLVAVLLVVAGVGLAWRSTARTQRGIRLLLVLCRGVGLVALAALLLNPGRWVRETLQTVREWAVLADRSRSMQVQDVDGGDRWSAARARAEAAQRAATGQTRVRTFTFDEQLAPAAADALGTIRADGKTTDIVGAGRAVLNLYRSGSAQLAGLLLATDGRQVTRAKAEDLVIECQARGCPVYAWPLGGPVARRDLRVEPARRQYVAFKGQRVRVAGRVSSDGLGPLRVPVSLLTTQATAAATVTVSLKDPDVQDVQAEFVPAEAGYITCRWRAPQQGDEADTLNNEASFGVLVLENRLRVLVAEGVPGWDMKFLVQLLRRQANLSVTAIYRVSAGRFFRVAHDANSVEESGQTIFPETGEALEAFDVVVFGKGAEYFLDEKRLDALHRFVRDQGGCVLFARGKPCGGPFPGLEVLEPVEWGEPVTLPFRVRPTRTGEEVGLFGNALAGPGSPVWQQVPPLRAAHRVSAVKAFTQVLAEAVPEGAGRDAPMPLLLSRRYGRGVVVTMNAEGFWQWDFFPSVAEAGALYAGLWSELIQWAATYSEFLPGQGYGLHAGQSVTAPDMPVPLRITRRHGAAPVSNLVVQVSRGNVQVQAIPAAPIPGESNRWSCVVTLAEPGHYRLEVQDAGRTQAGSACATLQVLAPPAEDDDLSADPEFLERLCRATGGELLPPDSEARVRELLADVPPEQVTARVHWEPFWNRGAWLLLMMAGFGVEWFVRRRNGLT